MVVELAGQFPASGRTLEQRSIVRVIPLGNYPYSIFYTVSGDELIDSSHPAQLPRTNRTR